MMIEYHPHGKMSLNGLVSSIAIEAEVIKTCDNHPYCYLKTGKACETAYQLAETLIEMEHVDGIERSQLHYAIEQFLHEDVNDFCPECGPRA